MILSEKDKKQIGKYFDDNPKKFSENDAQIVNWNNKYSQFIRFKVLTDIDELNDKSILDLGCGVGDMYQYLQLRYPSATYHGIDINETLINIAMKKYPAASFEHADLDSVDENSYDYVLASGIFAHRLEDYQTKYLEIIKRMLISSKLGIGFNMLKKGMHPDNETFVTFTAKEVKDKMKVHSSRVNLIEGYLPHDFTIHIFKEN